MRALGAALFVVAVLLVDVPSGAAPARADPAICGRPDYPNASNFTEDFVVDTGLWVRFRDLGGFGGGAGGRGSVRLVLSDAASVRIVTLAEITTRQYTGGDYVNATSIALRVREESPGGQVLAMHNFTLVSVGGRVGGNLTLDARMEGGALDVFWRWAYLPCTTDFVNAYYVFHGRVEGGAVTDDNTLVYFEAPRARRAPPVDLVLLIVTGIAVSVVFLLARHALKKRD